MTKKGIKNARNEKDFFNHDKASLRFSVVELADL